MSFFYKQKAEHQAASIGHVDIPSEMVETTLPSARDCCYSSVCGCQTGNISVPMAFCLMLCLSSSHSSPNHTMEKGPRFSMDWGATQELSSTLSILWSTDILYRDLVSQRYSNCDNQNRFSCLYHSVHTWLTYDQMQDYGPLKCTWLQVNLYIERHTICSDFKTSTRTVILCLQLWLTQPGSGSDYNIL